MLRIRTSDVLRISESVRLSPHIFVEPDSRFIAAENEKNGSCHFQVTDEVLQPAICRAWHKDPPLFRIISVETRSRCNMVCHFCPVNKSHDPRPLGYLPLKVIEKIANELAELNYQHTILLFGNNEPLLDERITEIIRLFRTCCPKSYIKILTNGTLVTLSKVVSLFEAGLSTLVVNNYTNGSHLIEPVQDLLRNAEHFQYYDLRVSVRKVNEVLTTRGGIAPNRAPLLQPLPHFCALPFVDICVTYTGKAIVCCFDAVARSDFGDINVSTLKEIWCNDKFAEVRKSLLSRERAHSQLCANCDFDGFRDPLQDPQSPITRYHYSALRAHETAGVADGNP